ncbi:MAG: biphenyl 2,3-dioxygenase [Cyanobacteria bacterium PR.023]|jgi:3-phenylpropionate/trans-cinnamate dioxygenase ferredoxin subunit|nr:biphenyl 2,3-dioxygenase [Cyanobacteria bacterium PR.023]
MSNSGFIRVAQITDVREGTAKVFTVGEVRIALCNVEEKFYAIADICTHDGGPLGEGELVDCQIECPRHGARFDVRTGKALCLPAVINVPTYPVEVRDSEVFVNCHPAAVGS